VPKSNEKNKYSKEWMINELSIENFKSIKSQKINCKKFNLFLGKPNVGKSNILEAIGLLGGFNSIKDDKFFSEYVRYEKIRNLFYDNDRNLELLIETNLGYVFSRFHSNTINCYDFFYGHVFNNLKKILTKTANYTIQDIKNDFNSEVLNILTLGEPIIQPEYLSINDEGKILSRAQFENRIKGNIKKYAYKNDISLTDRFSAFLKPPYGENVFALLETNPEVFDEFASMFEQYGLNLLFDNDTNKLEVQKTVGKRVYKIPFSLCADTLKRFIFNLLAIKTNKESIIILEEPEAHCFPPYITKISDEIINDDKNQYFIATHSPYLLADFLEKCEYDELALFITEYNDYQTTYRELTEVEIKNIKEVGIDFFYNIEAFKK
jgi:AAA15 family ATPase/GTPase